MKKKLLLTTFALVCGICCLLALVACNNSNNPSAGSHTHNYIWLDNGDGTHKQHCSVSGCDAPDIQNGNHDFSNGDCVCGKQKPADTHTHIFVDWTSDGEITCTGTCSCAETQTNNHTWDNGTVTTQGDCTTDAVKTYSCTNCHETKAETIMATGHPWGEWMTSTDINHTRECDICGEAQTAEHLFENYVCVDCGYDLHTEGLALRLMDDKKSYAVSGIGSSTEKDLIIPYEYGGLPVVCIDTNAFAGCTQLTSVDVPDSVTSIGIGAFSSCVNLESIVLPFIGGGKSSDGKFFGHIFGATTYTENDVHVPASLKTVRITSGEIVYDRAFWGCSKLTEIILPDTIKTIGEETLNGCSSLESLTLPFVGSDVNATEANEKTLFGYIFGTTSYSGGICVGQTYAERYTSDFIYYYIPATLNNVTVLGGEIFCGSFRFSCIYIVDLLNNITIGDKVSRIGPAAFFSIGSQYIRYKNVSIGNGVESIGEQAFYGCNYLERVTFGKGLKQIGSEAFRGCGRLTDITLPASIKSVGEHAFVDCVMLTRVDIKKGAEGLGSVLFHSDNNVVPVVYCEDAEKPSSWNQYWSGTDATVWDSKNNDLSENGLAYPVINGIRYQINPKTLVAMVLFTPAMLNETVMTVPASVTYNNKNYTVISVNRMALYKHTELTSLSLPDTLTAFDAGVEHCGKLSYNEYNNAFYLGNDANKHLVLIKTKTADIGSCVVNSNTKIIGFGAFSHCEKLSNITIPTGVGTISENAFNSCKSLTSIVLPDSVASLGTAAFEGCTKLVSITFSNKVKFLSSWVFEGCNALTAIVFHGSMTEWMAITKSYKWDENTGNYTVRCDDGSLRKSDG